MSLLLDDTAVAKRALKHIKDGTTDVGEGTWEEPVANYLSEGRLDNELSQIFRRYPIAFCPSGALPENGSYVARLAAGVPIIAVRGDDGKVRAFRNACRHRGMTVAEGEGCARAFVCNYHGWAYKLDGSLYHIPHEDGFPDFDKDQNGLVPVTAVEKSGMVFVTQDDPDVHASELGNIPDNLIGVDQRVISSNETVIEANWKVFQESFLEGYHIKQTHRETFFPYGYDNTNVVESFGRNGRICFPFKRLLSLEEKPEADWNLMGLVTFVHHLFPNVIIARLSHFTSLTILEPEGIDRTRMVGYMLTNEGKPATKEAEDKLLRDSKFVQETGVAEDREMVGAIQAGIHSNANDAFTFGYFEQLIVNFHRNLTELLAE